MDYYKASLKMHEEHKGKMAVASKVKVENKDYLSLHTHREAQSRAGKYTKTRKMSINTRTSPI